LSDPIDDLGRQPREDEDDRVIIELLRYYFRAILTKLDAILVNEENIMTALTDLQAAVAAEDTEIGQVIAYLNGLPALVAQLVAAAEAGDQATISAIAADINTQTTNLTTALGAAPTGGATGATGGTGATGP
jgi:hypothetical protein